MIQVSEELKNELSFVQCIDEVEGIWQQQNKIGCIGTDSIIFKMIGQ